MGFMQAQMETTRERVLQKAETETCQLKPRSYRKAADDT